MFSNFWGPQSNDSSSSGLTKVIFLAVAEAEGGKTSALEVEGEAEGLVFCI